LPDARLPVQNAHGIGETIRNSRPPGGPRIPTDNKNNNSS
jgi:hypothetical protein